MANLRMPLTALGLLANRVEGEKLDTKDANEN